MTLGLILTAVVVAVIVLVFLLAKLQRDSAWRHLASDLGAEFIDGGLFHSSKVQAHVQHGIVTLDTFSVSDGDTSTTYTRLRSPLQKKDGFQFTLMREGLLLGKLEKALGGRELQIGVPDFDRDFIIQGTNETKLRALLADAKLRQMIQGQRSINLRLKGDELHFDAKGVIKDVPRLKSLFELFGELLSRLQA